MVDILEEKNLPLFRYLPNIFKLYTFSLTAGAKFPIPCFGQEKGQKLITVDQSNFPPFTNFGLRIKNFNMLNTNISMITCFLNKAGYLLQTNFNKIHQRDT